jgi:SagB-type dehydrogenase family enzyme
MHSQYEKTSLTKKGVAAFGGYIDWNTQPTIFKQYPSFLFSYDFGQIEEFRFLELSRMITSKENIGLKPYYKLSTPSAGNLHPIELYIQVRGIKGIISGVYHVDVQMSKFVLLQEIEEDGFEAELGLSCKCDGIFVIVSCVPFRSEWKYGFRALRYCYLDAGHQLAAIQASATIYQKEMTILSEFDVKRFNLLMGFKDEETVCAVISFAKQTEKKVKALKKPLLHVSPTDYSDTNGELFEIVQKQPILKSKIFPISTTKEQILQRRSARKFTNTLCKNSEIEPIIQTLTKDAYPLVCYSILFGDEKNEAGIYLNSKLLQKGDYKDQLAAILVDQLFIKNAQMIVVVTSKDFSSQKLMLAGALVHKIALESSELKSTGIGAFYDKRLQDFLGTQNYILYVCALGK